VTVAAPYATGRTQCKHHWRIKPPEGPTSWGRCKLCGEEREFKNVMPWPYGKMSKAESVDFQKQLMAAVHQAGEYVT
jgi:hypothetical protein